MLHGKRSFFYAHVRAAACINASVCSSQLQKLSSSTAVKSTSCCVCRSVFNAVMTRTLSGYRPILNLCDQDDKNPHRSNLNFRHVALAYQQYSINSDILGENQQERSRRLKVCTKVVGAVVSEVMGEYRVGPILACKIFCKFARLFALLCNIDVLLLQDQMLPVPADVDKWCQDAADKPSGVLAFCSQWAQTLDHVSRRNTNSHPFE